MKLATKQTGRDGQLLVVNNDLSKSVDARDCAPTLQHALDNWDTVSPKLRSLAERLESGAIESSAFDAGQCAAPLPRAYQWIDGSAYVNHVELLRKSRNATLPDSFWTVPLLYQGGSDGFLNPNEPIPFGGTNWGVDFEAEVAVITDDVPMGVTADNALDHIKLYTIANDVSLRRLIPAELATGFGFFIGKPATAFAPVVVTPDEIADYMIDGKLDLRMSVTLNGKPFGNARISVDQVFTFSQLISHAAKTRRLCAGTILGGGTISNKLDGGPGLPVDAGGAGYSCIAEQRAVEAILHGQPRTQWLNTGDRVEIEILDRAGRSIFGCIDQTVTAMLNPS